MGNKWNLSTLSTLGNILIVAQICRIRPMTSHYRIPIIHILRNGKRSLYELSKLLAFDGKRMSNGTLVPILREMEAEGLITQEADGRKKYYHLTEKGVELHLSLEKVKKSLSAHLMNASVRYELMDRSEETSAFWTRPDFLGSVEKAQRILGEDWAALIVYIIRLATDGDDEGLIKLKRGIRELLEEGRNGH